MPTLFPSTSGYVIRGDFFEDWTGAPDSDGPDGWATPLFSRLFPLSLLPEP